MNITQKMNEKTENIFWVNRNGRTKEEGFVQKLQKVLEVMDEEDLLQINAFQFTICV